jgi:hypothetical protein
MKERNNFMYVYVFVSFFQSELFQDDIYPETASDVPAISGEDWFNGSSADPVLVCKLRLHDMCTSIKCQNC